jgi:hypothetical protein
MYLVAQTVKTLSAFYATLLFINEFKRAYHWSCPAMVMTKTYKATYLFTQEN